MAKHVTVAHRVVNAETHSTTRGDRLVLQVRGTDGRFAGSRRDLSNTVRILLTK